MSLPLDPYLAGMVVSREAARRAVACEGWRWMPGMRCVDDALCLATCDDDSAMCWYAEGEMVWDSDLPDEEPTLPDLSDAATLGCLLVLVRETWGRAGATIDILMLTIVEDDQQVRVTTIVAARGGAKVWSTTAAGPDCDGMALVAALEASP